MADPVLDPNAPPSGSTALAPAAAPVVPGTTPTAAPVKPGIAPAVKPPGGGMGGEAAKIRDLSYAQADNLDKAAQDAIKQIGAQGGELSEVMKRVRAAQDKADEAQTAATKALAAPPQQPVMDSLKKLNGLATFVGVFGGLFTKSPMTGSINAAADALEAYNKGDEKAYKLAYDGWKTQTDMLFKVADMQQSRVKDILYDEQMGLNERRSLLDVTLRAAGLTQLADAARIQGESVILDWQEKMQDAGIKYQEHKDAIQMAQERLVMGMQQREAAKSVLLTGTDPQGKQVDVSYNSESKTFTTPDGKPLDYEPTNLKKQGGGGTPRSPQAMYMAKYLEDHPDAKEDEMAAAMGRYSAEQIAGGADAKADSSSLTKLVPQKNAIESFENTAIKNGDILVDLAKKVDSTGVPVVERWLRAGRQSIKGDADVSDFNGQMFLYRSEVAKILTNPNLTGVLSDSARNEVEGFLRGNASAYQIERMHKLLKGDFGRRRASINDQIEEVRRNLKQDASGVRPVAPAPTAAPASAADIVPITDKAGFDALDPNSHYSLPGDPPGSYRTK